MKKLLIACFLVMPAFIFSQQPVQTIRGTVVDTDTQQPLPGVNIVIAETNPPVGTVTNMDGQFALEQVKVGRYTLAFSYLGYDTKVLPEVLVGSGKELNLTIQLKEAFQHLGEVEVRPDYRKDKAQNNMATLSARSFSVEEAARYAGGWNDPSRLAGSFAGVSMAEGVNDNAIVIRGNAPKGILWRLEGVEIPAPNHLNGVNNGGGIETVFSVSMLDNSDFFTGAFPAEYGNAMSGVFDIGFRNGNSSQRESAIQIGSQGIDISSEGPFKKDKEASYLFNYRYSTMGLVGQLTDINVGLPSYQDLSFKINLPTQTSGTFSLWGIGGLSNVSFDPEKDPSLWETSWDNNKYKTGSDIAAIGLNHRINLSSKSSMYTSLATTYDHFFNESEQLQRDGSIIPLADHKEQNRRMVASTYLNHKFGNKHTNRSGITFTNLSFDLDILGNPNPETGGELIRIADQQGQAQLFQGYSQSKLRLSPSLDANIGLNISYFSLNNEIIPEPRVGVTWRFMPKHSLSLAYGRHSRLEPLRFYLATNEAGLPLNPNLAVTKADHLVLAYSWRLSDKASLKIEPYYQRLYDVPVLQGTPESLINYRWDMYFNEALNNEGTGRNIGIDLTLERYMKQGFYYMATASVFNSTYKGGDGIERNTSFNRGYVFNVLGGKEWTVKQKNLFSINGKLAWMGGNRFSPPDQDASRNSEMVVLDESKAFEWQEEPRLFMDIAFNYRVNRTAVSHVFILQGKNVLMQAEMFGWAYDFKQEMVVPYGLTMVYPFFSYRLEF